MAPVGGDQPRELGRGDADYPAALAGLGSPPPRLWLRGAPPVEPAVAVVGTRHPDHTGRRLARAIGADLAARGVAVVSGLADGIDPAPSAVPSRPAGARGR